MKSIIITLSGPNGVGKTEVANALQPIIHDSRPAGNTLPWVSVRPFAEGVKRIARDSFGWTGDKTPKDRALLEGITVLREEFDPGGWARDWAAANLYNTVMMLPRWIIVDDERGVGGPEGALAKLIQAHGGHRFTINRLRAAPIGMSARIAEAALAPQHPMLYQWDAAARDAGGLIDNNAPDHGASAAAEIWARVKVNQ